MKFNFINRFWAWYNRNYLFNLSLAAFLFTLQLGHLYWLSVEVVFLKLFEFGLLPLSSIWEILILIVDYTEIPALIATSLIYINQLKKGFNLKSVLFLIFLNSQWLHIFWITDEYLLDQIDQINNQITSMVLPNFLTWLAIAIDYLELPVIFDTLTKLFQALKKPTLKKC